MALASRLAVSAALLATLAGLACHARGAVATSEPSGAAQPPRFDHLVVFVTDDALGTCLAEVFTPAERLATRHEGQGTSGRYFLFLNTFLELLKLEDLDEARANQAAFGSDYALRWSAAGSPFAVGVVVASLEPSRAGFPARIYAAPDGRSTYLMATGNQDARAPLVYATGPERAHPRRESLDEVDAIEDPGRRETVREYLTHPSGALTVTRIVVSLPPEALDSTNVELARELEHIEFVPAGAGSSSPHLWLELDGGTQGRTHECEGPPGVTLRW
ncbi:hypothetical protein PPSIR1_24509 [Plesiocystis pacifica SIR-1]|uniref:Uncharacterized protein n=1 Tax=Plesiocystis pacifica SIR-1 TaxID=391625 RepID=A6GGV8_9BACT|nr:hypothetical protein [Plesiocystis pacifica]EDM74899.1 hypothetical protein PPSIR1_24509 [Plesiocystis pacifica SIR-1]